MSWRNDLYQNGSIKVVREVGVSRKPKKNRDKEQRMIEICLNCTEKKCRGTCDKIRRVK